MTDERASQQEAKSAPPEPAVAVQAEGRRPGQKTWKRLNTRGTVGGPGDDATQAAMAAYVQRKRASLAGGASGNPRYYF